MSLLFSPRIAFSLTSTGSDGLPEIVAEQLQNLPAPLQFGGVTLSSDQFGNYLVTVRGRVRLAFFELPFAYTRALQLVGSLDPGRTSPVILAQPVGTPTVSGPYVLPYAAVLDRLIVDAVQHQFDAAVTRIASIELELAGASFLAQTVSVVAIQLVPYPTEVQAELSALCGGAVTGIIGPPMPDVAGSA